MLGLSLNVWMLHEQVGGPCEDCSSGFMASNQQSHEVVPKLLAGDVVPRRNEEMEDGRVCLGEKVLLIECQTLRIQQCLAFRYELIQGIVNENQCVFVSFLHAFRHDGFP